MAESITPSLSKPATIFTKTPSSSCILLFLLSSFIVGFFTLHHLPFSQSNTLRSSLHFRDIFLSSSNNVTLFTYLRALSLEPHLAGTESGLKTAKYVEKVFNELGLDAHITSYNVLLSYPVNASLSLYLSDKLVNELVLTEPGFEGSDVVQPYHAYSPSGSVYAKPVYVNYGREEDYSAVRVLGVNVTGCVVIVRRGEVSRGAVVEKAAEKGAVAVLMFTEWGKVKEEEDGEGVERGTVMLKGVGDPISPGWAGVQGGETLRLGDLEVSRRFPKIPSLPVSTKNAYAILGSLEGPLVPYEWRDNFRMKVGRIGPGPVALNFTYQGEKKMAMIHNVFAVIRGVEEPDRYVLLGNHRDAWTFGAVDPNSGTAALLDIARRYALLLRSRWIPRRTIVLCSWDAEEFGMIGSTEWVEQNILHLGSKAVAYLNVDCAVQGPGLFVASTPQLDNLFVEVTKKVKDPDSKDMTVFDKWTTTNRGGTHIQRLSVVGSDFVPFLQHAGVPSIDMYYGRDFPVYHTAYDSFNWMTTIGDPFFQRHVAVAGIWGLLALHLADDSILPFNYLSYAEELQGYVNVLSNLLEEISLDSLNASTKELASAAKIVIEEAKKLEEQGSTGDLLLLERRTLNDRLMLAERGFLDSDGLPDRKWFKHLIYGPRDNYESKLDFFPGIADAISTKKTTNNTERRASIHHEIGRVGRAIHRAATALRGEIT